MKVLENKYTSLYPKKVTCPHCKSELEYEVTDEVKEQQTKFDPRDGEPFQVIANVVFCPCCTKSFDVK